MPNIENNSDLNDLNDLLYEQMEYVKSLYKFSDISRILDLNEETMPEFISDEDLHIEI